MDEIFIIKCARCEEEKENVLFNKTKKRPNGHCLYCKQCISEYNHKNYLKNRKKLIKRASKWRKENRSKVNAATRQKAKTNRQFYLASRLRNKTRSLLRTKNSNFFNPTIGCSGNEFKKHIASQFKEGMSFDNYAILWNIDHIKPLKTFNLVDPDQYYAAAHYTNCRPVFIEDHNNFDHPGFTENENPWIQKYAR